MFYNTLFPVGTLDVPPILTTFASVALRKIIHTGVMDVYLKSNEFFGKRDSHPSLPKRNKPQW
jgi:hypothetical protein